MSLLIDQLLNQSDSLSEPNFCRVGLEGNQLFIVVGYCYVVFKAKEVSKCQRVVIDIAFSCS